MRDFTELEVWQKAHRFILDVYGHTRNFPAEERFGLMSTCASPPHRFRRTSPRAAGVKANESSPGS
jgi:hypothetical protein